MESIRPWPVGSIGPVGSVLWGKKDDGIREVPGLGEGWSSVEDVSLIQIRSWHHIGDLELAIGHEQIAGRANVIVFMKPSG